MESKRSREIVLHIGRDRTMDIKKKKKTLLVLMHPKQDKVIKKEFSRLDE